MTERKIGTNTGGRAGNRGLGRPKGAKNKTTSIAKQAIALAAENLGGAERLTEWVREDPANERAFWVTIYPRLLPVQVGGDPDNPIETVTRIHREIVRPENPDG